MVLYSTLNTTDRYNDDPEYTLGEKIRKQRNMKGLTAEELGGLCHSSKNTIYAYESNNAIPNPHTMKKIVEYLDVDVEYFEDDYYNFVLSNDYVEFLKKWRNENTKNHMQIEKILNISYGTYLAWEKGLIMSREFFNKIWHKIKD